MLLLPVLLLACDFSASTEVRADDSGFVDEDDTGATGGGGDEGGSGGEGTGDDGGSGSGDDSETDPELVDDDEDGWTEAQGDCDDTDPTINPDADDGCDGVDEDCDGETDEDAVNEDEYEPNDASGYDLGSLDDDTDRSIQAALHNDDDVDRFRFSFTDSGWSLHTLEVALSSLPEGAVYGLTVTHLETGDVEYTEVSSEDQSVSLSDVAFQDDGGEWEVMVEAWQGADCGRRYLLTIELD